MNKYCFIIIRLLYLTSVFNTKTNPESLTAPIFKELLI